MSGRQNVSLDRLRPRRDQLVNALLTRLIEEMERISGETWDEAQYDSLDEAGYGNAEALVDSLLRWLEQEVAK